VGVVIRVSLAAAAAAALLLVVSPRPVAACVIAGPVPAMDELFDNYQMVFVAEVLSSPQDGEYQLQTGPVFRGSVDSLVTIGPPNELTDCIAILQVGLTYVLAVDDLHDDLNLTNVWFRVDGDEVQAALLEPPVTDRDALYALLSGLPDARMSAPSTSWLPALGLVLLAVGLTTAMRRRFLT
jgi:hypothetical protein